MLEADERESIRLSAESIAVQLTKRERETHSAAAHGFAESLRAVCEGDDDIASRVSQVIAALLVTAAELPLTEAGDTLAASIAAYAFAAGSLAGVYDLDDYEPGDDQALMMPDPLTGQYL